MPRRQAETVSGSRAHFRPLNASGRPARDGPELGSNEVAEAAGLKESHEFFPAVPELDWSSKPIQ